MKRLTTAAACALLAVGLTAAPAAAAAPPTISGPSVVKYYAAVRLTGTTPSPHQHVQIFFRSTGKYALRRDLTSDATGHFATTYNATGTASYYARAGSHNSTVHTTRLVSASCLVSKPAFKTMPLQSSRFDPKDGDFVAFTANYGKLWAGVNADNALGRFAIITWRSGQQPKVLAKFFYRHVSWEPESPGSVNVVAVTRQGNVVAAVQDVHTNVDAPLDTFAGYVWIKGKAHRLTRAAGWLSVHPTGVAADGSIVGWVRAGSAKHPDYRVVRWSAAGTRPVTLADTMSQTPDPVVDGAGDVAYYDEPGPRVRRSDGHVVTLPSGPTPEFGVEALVGGTGHVMYGNTYSASVRWDLGTGTTPIRVTPLAGRAGNNWIVAAGPRGDIVNGYRVSKGVHVRTAKGAYVAVPHDLGVDPDYSSGLAFSQYGTLAFTSTKDRLVHFLVCH